MLNIYLIAALFGTAALIGSTLIYRVLLKKETSKLVVFTHGGVAATGLVLLFIYYLNNPEGLLIPLVIFVLAALGGFVLFFKDWTNQPIPDFVAFIHIGLALLGFCWLVWSVVG